jgi:hypothetical protein
MESNKKTSISSAGKGDRPRNCFSQKYRDNFDLIKWPNKNNTKKQMSGKK